MYDGRIQNESQGYKRHMLWVTAVMQVDFVCCNSLRHPFVYPQHWRSYSGKQGIVVGGLQLHPMWLVESCRAVFLYCMPENDSITARLSHTKAANGEFFFPCSSDYIHGKISNFWHPFPQHSRILWLYLSKRNGTLFLTRQKFLIQKYPSIIWINVHYLLFSLWLIFPNNGVGLI
jgi:hypothetical protein